MDNATQDFQLIYCNIVWIIIRYVAFLQEKMIDYVTQLAHNVILTSIQRS